MKRLLLIITLLVCSTLCRADELVYQDRQGVVRWRADRSEVALFGVNYCLPSACDYRAAGMVGGNRKQMIDDDIAHFVRMGFDAIRLSFWGDWENSDREGNLVGNDHLDLLDYLIHRATENGIYMLLSPIVTYDSMWPDYTAGEKAAGFSALNPKHSLITEPEIIKAEVNYVGQLLNHKNPYTGRLLKEEPNILFVELINEPTQMPDLPRETKHYIDTMIKAIRRTGCRKLLYYNISQDFRIAPIVARTKIDGGTYAWYPTQLNAGYTLEGNFLPFVADYSQIGSGAMSSRSKLVYEFDAPDLQASYMYPAMVREYRRGGVQFAAMFSYDMLATAPYNLGWQTHNLNMVYTPHKAVSAIIAARAMKLLPRGAEYGAYPQNSQFGNFEVDWQNDCSVLAADGEFFYSNDTRREADAASLRKIVGCGSSRVVATDSRGIYFFDKLSDGVWRMEFYPDAICVGDPFNMPSTERIRYELVSRPTLFDVSLPDLGDGFRVQSLDGETVAVADGGRVTLTPSVYILSRSEVEIESLPATLGRLKMNTYVVPEQRGLAKDYFVHTPEGEYITPCDKVTIGCSVYSDEAPLSVNLFVRNGWRTRRIPMQKQSVYDYSVEIELPQSGRFGVFDYHIGVEYADRKVLYPSGEEGIFPDEWDYTAQECYRAFLTDGSDRLKIFDAATDSRQMRFTKVFRSVPFAHRTTAVGGSEMAVELSCNNLLPSDEYAFPIDVTCSSYIAESLRARCAAGLTPKAVAIRARRTTPTTERILLSLNQSDCAAWSAEVALTDEFGEIVVPVEAFAKGRAPMLPQDWPGINPYWYPDTDAKAIDWSKVENIFFSMRDTLYPQTLAEPKGFQILSVELIYQP